ncbi:MAG: ribonuclease III domain-containing protein, partial [Benniella sp.]
IDYKFKDRKLLELALTAPVKSQPSSPNYNRLEYLGDAVMEVVAIQVWMNKGVIAGAAKKTEDTACNRALQAVCIAAGLHNHIKKCEGKKPRIKAIKAAYDVLEPKSPNKAYWLQGAACKTLGDVVESVYGAVFLDSGLRLSAVEGVFKRIHWPIVERRLA